MKPISRGNGGKRRVNDPQSEDMVVMRMHNMTREQITRILKRVGYRPAEYQPTEAEVRQIVQEVARKALNTSGGRRRLTQEAEKLAREEAEQTRNTPEFKKMVERHLADFAPQIVRGQAGLLQHAFDIAAKAEVERWLGSERGNEYIEMLREQAVKEQILSASPKAKGSWLSQKLRDMKGQ